MLADRRATAANQCALCIAKVHTRAHAKHARHAKHAKHAKHAPSVRHAPSAKAVGHAAVLAEVEHVGHGLHWVCSHLCERGRIEALHRLMHQRLSTEPCQSAGSVRVCVCVCRYKDMYVYTHIHHTLDLCVCVCVCV